MMNPHLRYYGLSLLVVCVDQAVKLWVHYNMLPGFAGEIIVWDNLFTLRYVSNPGMAFGVELGFAYGKLVLTLLRFLIISFVAYYLHAIIASRQHTVALCVCVACMFGGALGNFIDGVFHGVLLDNAPPHAPMQWFYGQVVDMFYIHIWSGYLPAKLPLLGGQPVSLWPVFNVADASIFVSVLWVIVFRKKVLKGSPDSLFLGLPKKAPPSAGEET